MTLPTTLSGFLSAHTTVAPAADKTAAAAPAAVATPAPAAAPAKAAAAAAPAPAAAPAKAAAAPAPVLTEAQKWAKAQLGEDVGAKAAEILYKQAEAEFNKQAEAEKLAAVQELEARGVLIAHGELNEKTASRMAAKVASANEIFAVCATTGVDPRDLEARAQQIRKQANLLSSNPESGWVTQFYGSGANPADSEVLAQAARNGATTEFQAGASSGTRQPSRGVDGKLLRFEESVTLPGNPGVAAAGITQPVDHGKGPQG